MIIGILIASIFAALSVVLSVYTFTVSLTPSLKGIWPVLCFLIVPIIYGLIGCFFYRKNKPRYDSLNKSQKIIFDAGMSFFINAVLFHVLFFLFLLVLYFPAGDRGINNEPLVVEIQPYLLNNDAWIMYSENELLAANKIYSKYNISLEINDPIQIERPLNKSDEKSVFEQNCTILNELYNLTNQNSSTINLILANYSDNIEGMASICGHNDLILMSLNTTLPSAWILSHELGHSLKADISCWKTNLMKEHSRACNPAGIFTHDFIRNLQSDFLYQTQVDAMVKTIKSTYDK